MGERVRSTHSAAEASESAATTWSVLLGRKSEWLRFRDEANRDGIASRECPPALLALAWVDRRKKSILEEERKREEKREGWCEIRTERERTLLCGMDGKREVGQVRPQQPRPSPSASMHSVKRGSSRSGVVYTFAFCLVWLS